MVMKFEKAFQAVAGLGADRVRKPRGEANYYWPCESRFLSFKPANHFLG